MHTVIVRFSAKEMCAPVTVNRLLKAVRNDPRIQDIFWPNLTKDKSISCGKRAGVKLDQENLDYLRTLKRTIRQTFGIFVSYSLLICALVRLYKKPQEQPLMSLNVKGYKALRTDFEARLKGITKQIKATLPEIVLLQEFRVGENEEFLNILMKELGRYYKPIYPASYQQKDDYNNCICIMLIGKNITNAEVMSLRHDNAGYRLRYNHVRLDKNRVILNAWAPQMYNAQQDWIKMAEAMWNDILSVAQKHAAKNERFYLAGDLNAYEGSMFEDKLMRLNTLLVDTKNYNDWKRPTGPSNVLDYFFVNRSAAHQSLVTTSIFLPSIKRLGLSDHEALITTVLKP